MNNNKLIIAAAGAGKTTLLVSDALKQKGQRVLITTYTQNNELEIRNKILELNKFIPENISVQTWFSFLIHHGARPYQGCIYSTNIKGMIFTQSRSGVKCICKGRPIVFSELKEFAKHYFCNGAYIYSDKLAKFVVRCNEKSKGMVIDRISRIYQHIFIDEVQDLAGYDLEILLLLFKSNSRILLAGDPRQVTYLTHHENKYSKYRNGMIKEFIRDQCPNGICNIDENTLSHSHRCCDAICNFASNLYPNLCRCGSKQVIDSHHQGVFLVKPKDVKRYLEIYKPVELFYNKAEYPALNYGQSKGLGFERVLIYPTQTIEKYLSDGNLSKTIKKKGSQKTEIKPAFDIAKFYVALTRAKHSVGIVYDYDVNTNIEGTVKFTFPKEV